MTTKNKPSLPDVSDDFVPEPPEGVAPGTPYYKLGTVTSLGTSEHHENNRSSENFNFNLHQDTNPGQLKWYVRQEGQPNNKIRFDVKQDKSVAVDPTIHHELSNQCNTSCADANHMAKWYIANPAHTGGVGFDVVIFQYCD